MAITTSLSVKKTEEARRSAPVDPFRLIAQQYIPTNIKKAFQRALIFYKSDILIMRMVNKLAEYPITSIEIEVDDYSKDELELSKEQYQDIYEKIFNKALRIDEGLISIGQDYFLYQNAFPYLSLPVERKYRCQTCISKLSEGEDPVYHAGGQISTLTWDGKDFRGHCPECKKERLLIGTEDPVRNGYSQARLRLRNLYRIGIEVAEITGAKRYTYSMSHHTVKKIMGNDRFILDNTPLIFLRQAHKNKAVELDDKQVYHFKAPSPTTPDNSPWAWPLIIAAMQTLFYIQNMKKALEAISIEHMNPNVYIAPRVDVKTLSQTFNVDNLTEQIGLAYEEGRNDVTKPSVFPVPVEVGLMNLNGRMFLPNAEINAGMSDLYIGMGMPRGLLSGEGPHQANSIAMRVIENGFLTYRSYINNCLQSLSDELSGFFNLPPAKIKMTEFIKLDDSLHKQALQGGAASKMLSKKTYLESLGLDPTKEAKWIDEETKQESERQGMAETSIELARGKAMEESEIDRMSSQTEMFINESQKRTDHLVSLAEGLISKGYTPAFATDYVSKYMSMEADKQQAQAADARRQEERAVFFKDRMAGAVHSLNRANTKFQTTSELNNIMGQPQQQEAAQQEQGNLGSLVNRLMAMDDTSRTQEMQYIQRSQPAVWSQISNIMGSMNRGTR